MTKQTLHLWSLKCKNSVSQFDLLFYYLFCKLFDNISIFTYIYIFFPPPLVLPSFEVNIIPKDSYILLGTEQFEFTITAL